MSSAFASRKRRVAVFGASTVFALILVGCTGGGGETDGGGQEGVTVVVGTTDRVTSIDPAGSYDNGSFAIMNQVYPFLMNTPYGSPDVEPDIAESGEFTAPDEYTVTLKSGLVFANGNELTSSDVKFTFDRQLQINAATGPASLLGNLESVDTPDDLTVVFNLRDPEDQTFPQVLSSPAGPIVDEDVFPADEVMPDDDIVAQEPFAGQYTITQYDLNNLVQFERFDGYQGVLGPAENARVNLRYFTDSNNLKLAVQEGDVDVAHRSLSATDVEDLENNDQVTVHTGPGGEIRYIVFNFDTQPYGAQTDDADPERALAVREAIAHLIDRSEISEQVYRGTYTPLYSYVPEGLTGAVEPLIELYGDGSGGPDPDAAEAVLADAGVETPVQLSLQYSPDHYGPSSGDEYALIQDQLESSGLFEVDLQSTEWTQYSQDRVEDVYPAYQLGWFPDYSDASNYLAPFFGANSFLANHYDDPAVQELVDTQRTTGEPAEREALIEQIQREAATDLPTLPYLQGAQIAVAGTDVSGIVLDASFKFRYAPIIK